MPSPEAELLKVAPEAGLAEIKKAYRKAALLHHPDQNPDPQAGRHFRKLTEAYRLLSEQAQKREPVPARRTVPPHQRVEFLLADIRALVRRWPSERWAKKVDGLPAAVWVAGILDVLANIWPETRKPPAVPSQEGIAAALAGWQENLGDLRPSGPLNAVLDAAERRLSALDRPRRGPSN